MKSDNGKRLVILAGSLRTMALAAENATCGKDLVGIIKGLQEAISLVSLCMFACTRKIIQDAKHDIDPTEEQK